MYSPGAKVAPGMVRAKAGVDAVTRVLARVAVAIELGGKTIAVQAIGLALNAPETRQKALWAQPWNC